MPTAIASLSQLESWTYSQPVSTRLTGVQCGGGSTLPTHRPIMAAHHPRHPTCPVSPTHSPCRPPTAPRPRRPTCLVSPTHPHCPCCLSTDLPPALSLLATHCPLPMSS